MQDYEKHLKLLSEFETTKELYKERIKISRIYLGKKYRMLYSKRFLILDVLFILAILCNIGALLCTNMLVLKVEPEKKFVEANPITAKTHGFEPSLLQIGLALMVGFILHSFVYVFLIFNYIYHRNRTFSESGYSLLMFMVLTILCFWGYDFLHDLGYVLGKVIFA